MSKKDANVELKLVDEQRAGRDVTVLYSGKVELGYIVEAEKTFEVYAVGSHSAVKVKTQKDAENELIMQYNLHQG